MPWYVKFAAAGLAVTLAALVAKKFGPSVGGMLLSFPFVIGSGLFFAMETGETSFRQMATGALFGLLALAGFLAVVLLVNRWLPMLPSLGIGLAAWLLIAGVVQALR